MKARSSSTCSKVVEDGRAEIKIVVTVGGIVEPAVVVVVKVIIEASEVAVVVGRVACITQISHSQRGRTDSCHGSRQRGGLKKDVFVVLVLVAAVVSWLGRQK